MSSLSSTSSDDYDHQKEKRKRRRRKEGAVREKQLWRRQHHAYILSLESQALEQNDSPVFLVCLFVLLLHLDKTVSQLAEVKYSWLLHDPPGSAQTFPCG